MDELSERIGFYKAREAKDWDKAFVFYRKGKDYFLEVSRNFYILGFIADLLDNRRLDYFFEVCRDLKNSQRFDKKIILDVIYQMPKIINSSRESGESISDYLDPFISNELFFK